MTSEYRESVGVGEKTILDINFAFCTDVTGVSASNLHARHRSADKIYCDVGQKTIVFVTFHKISRGKGLGIGAKIGAFPIVFDVSVPLPSTVT